MEPVVVGKYADIFAAMVAVSALESAGISASLLDEAVSRMTSSALGGARVQVDAADEQAARDLLRQITPGPIQFEEGKVFEQPKCPACGSAQVSMPVAPVRALIACDGDAWACDDCGARWEDTDH